MKNNNLCPPKNFTSFKHRLINYMCQWGVLSLMGGYTLLMGVCGATFPSDATAQTAQTDLPLEPGYTEYDRHTAVISCMEYIYLQKYTTFPAEQDAFPLCEQRFLELSRRLSHEQFVRQRQSQNQEGNTYYNTLFGVIPKELQESLSTQGAKD